MAACARDLAGEFGPSISAKLAAAEKLDIDPGMTVEEMSLNAEWKAEVTEIRIDGSDPSDYRPLEQAA